MGLARNSFMQNALPYRKKALKQLEQAVRCIPILGRKYIQEKPYRLSDQYIPETQVDVYHVPHLHLQLKELVCLRQKRLDSEWNEPHAICEVAYPNELRNIDRDMDSLYNPFFQGVLSGQLLYTPRSNCRTDVLDAAKYLIYELPHLYQVHQGQARQLQQIWLTELARLVKEGHLRDSDILQYTLNRLKSALPDDSASH
jgi:hypothetical protein